MLRRYNTLHKHIVSFGAAIRKRNRRSLLAVIFVPIFKEDDTMWAENTKNGKVRFVERYMEPALTSGQIEKAMINCKSTRDKAIISFMYETGARVSEVAGVQLSDIDFNEHTVLLHGKGGKDRISMFTDKSAMYLEEYLTNRDLTINALFESKNKGCALSAAGIRSMIHDVGVRSGITRLHPHRFRVSRITHLVDRGMPLQDVQELAGHTSINTTRSYYRNTLENVKHSYLKAAQ